MYGATSAVTALVEFSLLHALLIVHVTQSIAVSAAFLSASAFQFLVLRYGVFKVTHRHIAFQVNTFVIAGLVSWGVVVGSVALITTLVPIGTMAARAIVIPVLFPVNYLTNRYLVFRK
jgi:putative flippase GtrA